MTGFMYGKPILKYEKFVHDVSYTAQAEFPNGTLPLEKDVLCCMLYLHRPDRSETERIINDAAEILAYNLIEHWHLCNINTIPAMNVTKKIVKLYTEFQLNYQTRENRKHDKWKKCMQLFNEKVCTTLFNIYTQDPNPNKELHKEFSITMTQSEYDFLEDQKVARLGFCADFMDRKWEQRAAILSNAQSNHGKNIHLEKYLSPSNCDNDSVEGAVENYKSSTYIDKSKIENTSTQDNLNDIGQMISNLQDMPEKWSHIRLPDSSIRPEFYSSVDQLINVYQCNKYQAISAVITVANMMFGRNWKHYDSNSSEVDEDTAPEAKEVIQIGIERTIEFVALKCILEEIIEVGDANIIFHHQNPKLLSIKGMTISGKFRTFPKISLAKESRENFRDMRLAVLSVLALYAGDATDELSNKITFSMSDGANPETEISKTQVALEVARYTIGEKKTDNLETRFDDEQFDLIIDVRSPGEYKLDHIPRALNMPVLNNEERCKVGTIYSGDPKSARGIGAAIISRSISSIIEEHFLSRSRDTKILVYCWRGGLRSKSLAVILNQVGFDGTKLLTGGYKVFRQHIQNSLPLLIKSHQYSVVAGNTGTGKSIILECMQETGEQVLHLEELAKHKGSVLGPYFACEQPTQKQFETDLWDFLRNADSKKPIWLEHEGIQIGKIYLPKDLYQMINDSSKVFIKVDLKTRVDHLLRDYIHFLEHPETLADLLDKLIKFVGKKQVIEWKEMVSNRKFPELVSSLITEHYDKAYDQKRKRESQEMGNNCVKTEFQWPTDLELKRESILSSDVLNEIINLRDNLHK